MTVPEPQKLSEEIITIPEVAWLTGAKRGTVERWNLRNQGTDKALPEPDDWAGSTPVWRADRMIAWLDATGRKHQPLSAWRKHKAAGGFRRKAVSLV